MKRETLTIREKYDNDDIIHYVITFQDACILLETRQLTYDKNMVRGAEFNRKFKNMYFVVHSSVISYTALKGLFKDTYCMKMLSKAFLKYIK